MKKFIAILLMVAMLVTVFAGCGQTAEASKPAEENKSTAKAEAKNETDPIKIAYVGPLTGDSAEYGQTMSNAVQIAVEDINAQGGINGQLFELVSYDDKNDATEATTVAEKVCADKSIVAVIGHFSSGVAMAAASVYEENGMPYIAISAAHPDLCEGEYIFRNNALYDTEASSVLQTIASKGAAKYGILVENSDAGVSVTTQVENWLEQFGDAYTPELATIQRFDSGATDMNAQIQEFIAAGCEVVYTNAAYAQVVPFITQYRTYDQDVEFIISAACFSPTFLEAAGENAEGCVLATSFFYGSTNEAVKAFVDKYTEKYGSNPSNFCGQSYDAAFSYFYAIEKAGSSDRDAIRDALHEIEFEGLTGAMSYNEIGECLKQQTLVGVENGQWVEYPGILLSASAYLEKLTK